MLLVKNGAGKSGEEERRNKRSLKDNNLLGAQRVFVCLDKELKLTNSFFFPTTQSPRSLVFVLRLTKQIFYLFLVARSLLAYQQGRHLVVCLDKVNP